MAEETYSIPLSEVIGNFHLDILHMPKDEEGNTVEKTRLVTSPEVSRPGLAFAGYFGVFESYRMQIIGKAEQKYLETLEPEVRRHNIRVYMEMCPVAVILTTNFDPFPEMLEAAEEFGVPLLRTKEKTSAFMAALIAYLNVQLAPRITRHGVLVEVYGEGILILGDSGVGKSETAIELVKRGHRLIADDAVEIKRVSATTLVGSAPAIIRHYVELRGIGIVDVRRLFGMGAVKDTEKIDLVIQMEPWIQGKMYDRLGLDTEQIDILGIQIPTITIPVKPGRNLAIILEIAAMNNRQKKMGYNTAEEFNKKLLGSMGLE
ncbi:MAG: HPr(Ser) kinase/phosphatase [Clostridia bacterium]|nr:HPr(Ser) kinase/phosphatase [Clostridia bacterium]